MQVHLKALGCRLNEAELETWARTFRDQGVAVTLDPAQADLVVVNTCAVTEEAVRKSRRLLRRIHRDNPDAKVVVTGCYPSINPDEPLSLPGIDLVVDNARKDRLPQIVAERLDLRTAPAAAAEPGENLLFARGRQRAFIKVQDGCRYRCTYCIVTLARGDERSRSLGEIVDEINALGAEGVQEAVLAGVHLGGYGSDTGHNLKELVSAILTDTDLRRLRIGSLEPWDIPDGFWPLFDNPRLMPHLHLPVQSGSDSVLRRMARRCRADEFRRLVAYARERIGDFNVTTDIIVGFPGESGAEFQETLALVDDIGFGHVHVFSFSPRAGTKAASLSDPVPEDEKRERSRILHELAAERARSAVAAAVGRTVPVLVESMEASDEGERAWGYTPGFMRTAIEVPGVDETLENVIIDVRLAGVHADGHLVGKPCGRIGSTDSTEQQGACP